MTDPLDPLDKLGLTYAKGDAAFDDDESVPPRGYGHIPQEGTGVPAEPFPIARVQIRRDVFWQNVCREILMALAAAAAQSSGRLDTGPSAAESSTSPIDELFDGRMGVITHLGQRIPIADVVPVFSFSVPDCAEDRSRSNDVQCTVFRITTPTGETYTLPITQIVGVHTLSASLIEQLEESQNNGENEADRIPFGFSAYTSMARSEQHAQPEDHPQDQPDTEPNAEPNAEPDAEPATQPDTQPDTQQNGDQPATPKPTLSPSPSSSPSHGPPSGD